MALKQRMEKLEKANNSGNQPMIVFYEDEKTEAGAIAEWEAENGPLFNREPMVVQIRRFSSPPSGI
jgi:hypothetical protein